MKNKKDMIKWLNNLKSDIGQPQHSQLWHYVEILDVIARYLESTDLKPERPKGTETMIVDGMEIEIDPVSYEVGYTHGQFSERPKGEWIGEGDGYADGGIVYDTWYCSKCDHCEEGEELALPNFCPNCGAKMKGGAE